MDASTVYLALGLERVATSSSDIVDPLKLGIYMEGFFFFCLSVISDEMGIPGVLCVKPCNTRSLFSPVVISD